MQEIKSALCNGGEAFKFLVVDAGRSGTSLLAALLDHHSQLTLEVELGGASYLRGKVIEDRGESMFEDRAGGFLKRCLQISKDSPTPQWGNKITTEQVAGLKKHNMFNVPPLDILAAFFNDLLAPLKIVYLLRDGRACIQSKLRRTEQSLESACTHWCFSVEVMQMLEQRDNVYFLRFEDLVRAPHKTLAPLCEFLDVTFEAGMLEGTSSDKMMPSYRRASIESERAFDLDINHPCLPLIEK